MDVDDAINRLLVQYPTLKLTDDGQRVKCTLTGHEMPLKPDIIELYTGSKRYTRMLGFQMSPYYQKYKQFFTDCTSKKRNRSQIYCTLTKHFVNRTPWHMKMHVEGANFIETYQRWSRRPWTLHGSAEAQATVKTDADDDDPEKQSEEVTPEAVVKSEPAADDNDDDGVDDILHRGRYYRSRVGDVKEEADDRNRDADNGDDDDDDDDGDSYSDLYPENDLNEMESGESAEQSRNPLKRHVKQKKPKVLDMKAKMRRTDEDYMPL